MPFRSAYPGRLGRSRHVCAGLALDRPTAGHVTVNGKKASPKADGSEVVCRDEPVLVRNYDYNPDLFEWVVYSSKFAGRKVIGTSDCLWGLVDGMNDDGLVISLTHGGRQSSAPGFAIPGGGPPVAPPAFAPPAAPPAPPPPPAPPSFEPSST